MDDIGIGQALDTAFNIYVALSLVFVMLGSIGLFRLVRSKFGGVAAGLAVALTGLLQTVAPFVMLPVLSLHAFAVSLLITFTYAVFGVTAFFLSRRGTV
jgi:hypothetical protein